MHQKTAASVAQSLCNLAQVQTLEDLTGSQLVVQGIDFFYSGRADFIVAEHNHVRLENNAGNVLILSPGKTVCTVEWALHLSQGNQTCGQIISPSETKKYSVYVDGKIIFNHTGMTPMQIPLR